MSKLEIDNPVAIELKYVHEVYDAIACHFNKTRYSVWNKVKLYINSLPTDCIIGEIGCGNGKNMQLRSAQFIGCDQSASMVKLCQTKGLNCVQGNIIDLGFKDETFNHTICIAVIHHLASHERRLKAVKEIIRVTKKGGTMMIMVWALEQKDTNKTFDQQDMMVPWSTGSLVSQRYYHVFKEGELESLIGECSNIKIIESFQEMGNWGVIIQRLD